jgi:hypothetical protein
MIQIDDTIISLDLLEKEFICDLSACLGCCCNEEGDSGAPLEEDEVELLKEVLPVVWDDLSPAAHRVIEEEGVAFQDEDGDWVTPVVNGRDCVFTCYGEGGMCYCAIEKAYREGRTQFYKPVSCHLYPVRCKRYPTFTAVNYHRWSICKAAEVLGRKEGVKVYQFLKEPLIRKFGKEWYEQLELCAEELKKEGII